MQTVLAGILAATVGSPPEGGGDGVAHGATAMLLVPALTLLGVVLTGLCAALRVKNKLPAWISVGLLAASFVIVLKTYLEQSTGVRIAHGFEWITFSLGQHNGGPIPFVANFSLYVDSLTLLWMLFVTGLGALIALYASEYMSHDVGAGYCRFFAAFNLFVFSMSCLVMADNLLLLFLGWEGVGLCSYLLIGYFYKKPAAVAAAKKAFIMNRIGDLGLVLGMMGTFVAFGTIQMVPLFDMISRGVDGAGQPIGGTWVEWVLPMLFTVGAFGKSAQLFFYVWLPDAMEGPTPVSALIHAATMVTAGVFLIARMMPLYTLDESHFILSAVAWSGAITAFWAATIGMAHFDIKRIMGYSTVSQLGFMFAGLGVMTSTGAAFHVFTHAFFKATLFLACGAVMHGFAGQLDLRKLSGLRKMPGWRIVALAMLVGALNLAGFPLLAGYWSKDIILAEAFVMNGPVGWILLLTAGLTAYYTFRAYFRVFEGPVEYHAGDDHHGADDQAHDGHGHDGHDGHAAHTKAEHGHEGHGGHGGEFHPHAPGWAINLVLTVLSVGCFAIIPLTFMGDHGGWVGTMVHHSTAHIEHAGDPALAPHGTFLGMDPHKVMYYVSGIVGFVGIAVAWWLHLAGRTSAATSRADALAAKLGPIVRGARGRWYVDEIYDFLICRPLWVLAHVFHQVDQWIVDGLVNLTGGLPRFVGATVRPSQSGELHGYAVGMAGGVAVLLIVVLLAVS